MITRFNLKKTNFQVFVLIIWRINAKQELSDLKSSWCRGEKLFFFEYFDLIK